MQFEKESFKAKSKKNKNKAKHDSKGELSRRTMLKMGAAAGAVTVLTSRKSMATSISPYQTITPTPPPPPEPAICTTFTGSPATRPFMQQLPIPTALKATNLSPAPTQSANIAAGEAPRADHQRWNEFLPQKQYLINVIPATVSFHPDL